MGEPYWFAFARGELRTFVAIITRSCVILKEQILQTAGASFYQNPSQSPTRAWFTQWHTTAVKGTVCLSPNIWEILASRWLWAMGPAPQSITASFLHPVSSQRTPAVGASIFLHKKGWRHAKDSLCLHGGSQPVCRGKWTSFPDHQAFLTVYGADGRGFAESSHGQPSDPFPFLLLTPNMNMKGKCKWTCVAGVNWKAHSELNGLLLLAQLWTSSLAETVKRGIHSSLVQVTEISLREWD